MDIVLEFFGEMLNLIGEAFGKDKHGKPNFIGIIISLPLTVILIVLIVECFKGWW